MGYDHSMLMRTQLKSGVTTEEVEQAFEPLLEYFDETLNSGDPENYFNFTPETGEVDVSTCGEVSYSYHELVEEVADRLGPLVDVGGEFDLYDHDTGDIDNAHSVYVFGPSDEAIKTYITKRDLDEAMELMKRHLPEAKIGAIQALISAS